MRDVLGPGTILGYCTNVHAGPTLEAVQANLATHAVAVREHLGLTSALGIGLWLAAPAARALRDPIALRRFADWLAARDLEVFTINGFPYGDFHEPVVKHRVYEPNWTRPERLAYTLDLLHVLAGLRPDGGEGSISTLPLGWPVAIDDDAATQAAAGALRTFTDEAARVELDTGRHIHL
ncbi:MAG: hypothetical protein KJO43_01230, partial [Phycisphaerae bacterium]|nr:hypothetical protein [Phycisphaerae bacterium]